MTSISHAHLQDRSLLRVAGDDAHHFLQNLVTVDLDELESAGAAASALLTPQGKIQFDFLMYRSGDAYLLDTPAATVADLAKRLAFYRLRAKVDIEQLGDDIGVFALWGDYATPANANPVPGAMIQVTDPRLNALGQRLAGPVGSLAAELGASPADADAYDAHRIALGVPEALKDFDYSDIFPHDADLDQLGGVSFRKGCFVGQEVVARMQHRGTVRKRFVQVESATPLPVRGTSVTVDDKSVGTIGSSTSSVDGSIGLALLRLDKVGAAKENGILPKCGDAELQVRIPDWASFTWPETDTAD